MAQPSTVEDMKATAHRGAPYGAAQLSGLSSEHRMVSPEEAKALRAACHYERQRDISQRHVTRLASEMSRGWFLQGTPIWFCVSPDQSMVIVNGNHTLEAIAEAGISVPLTFIYQQVVSDAEIARAYAAFDIQRTRSWAAAAHAAGLDTNIVEVNKVLAAIGYLVSDFAPQGSKPAVSSRQARFAALEEYRGAYQVIHAAWHGSPQHNNRVLLRAPVYAVALATARYQPSKAEEFWGGMAFDDGLRSNDPRKVLLRYLHNRSGDASHRRLSVLASSAAWNLFFKGGVTEYLKPQVNSRFWLLGTPWGRGETIQHPDSKSHHSKVVVGTTVNGRGEKRSVAAYQA